MGWGLPGAGGSGSGDLFRKYGVVFANTEDRKFLEMTNDDGYTTT